MRIGCGRDMGQRAKGQTIADRAVTGHQKQMAAPQFPTLGYPGLRCFGLPALDRQHIAGRFGQAPGKDAGHAAARLGVLEFRIFRRHVFGQIALFQQPLAGVLKGRGHIALSDTQ